MILPEPRKRFPKCTEPGVSVVVPVYNSAETLPILIDKLHPVLAALGVGYEVILVNDGSRDESWDGICALSEQYPFIVGIHLMRNFGQHNALLCGVRSANYNTTVTLDDDLQNPPEEIPRLLDKLKEGCDVVYGYPRQREHGLWRSFASATTRLSLRPLIGPAAQHVSSFRAFRTSLRRAFRKFDDPHVSLDVLLTWGGDRYAALEVEHQPRKAGRSTYTIWKLASHAMDMMTGFSTLPLRLASLIGLVFTGFGCGVLVYVIVSYLVNAGSIPGFPFLASIVALFSGAQLFALGVIGEYLARMHFRSMRRPPYVVD